MLNTFVVESWLTVADVKEPCTEKILTPDFILDAIKLASPRMVCFPVRYVPAAISWLDVLGVMVAAAFVVTDAVSDTLALVAVPAET